MRPICTSFLAVAAPALAQTFAGLGAPASGSSDAAGISGDGTTVVGIENTGTAQNAFRWTLLTGRVPLPLPTGFHDGVALAASLNGVVVAGHAMNSQGNSIAIRWTMNSPVLLGTLPGGLWSYGLGISRGGNIVLGASDWDFAVGPNHAFRWNGGMFDLGQHPNIGLVDFAAIACSDDGAIIIGNANDLGGNNRVFRWTFVTGMTDIGPPNPLDNSYAGDVSADGTVVVGYTELAPFRWTAQSGLVPLPLPRGMGGEAACVNANGTVSGGHVQDTLSRYAAFWDSTGFHDLASTLGPALPAGWTLQLINGVSDDGRVFCGTGTHNGVREGWIAALGNGCYANCDNSTIVPVLNVQDFTCFLNRFASADTYANCDNSTIVPVLNIQDFTCFLNKFAAGCS